MNTNRDELLPCPFCGSTDLFGTSNGIGSSYIECEGCGASGSVSEGEESDAEKWNRRTPPPSGDGLPELVKRWRRYSENGKKTNLGGTFYLDQCADELEALLQSAQVGGGDVEELIGSVQWMVSKLLELEATPPLGTIDAIRRLAQPQRELTREHSLRGEVIRFITDTPEDVTHKALLAEGWTPPGQQPASAAVGRTRFLGRQSAEALYDLVESSGTQDYFAIEGANAIAKEYGFGANVRINQQADKAGDP